MTIKSGVSVVGIKPEIMLTFPIIDDCYKEVGAKCVLTSGTEGTHGRGSLHYVGLAADFRTNTLKSDQKTKLLNLVVGALTGEYDVILEKTHLHVEFQPK